jgi:hypothetical protein
MYLLLDVLLDELHARGYRLQRIDNLLNPETASSVRTSNTSRPR